MQIHVMVNGIPGDMGRIVAENMVARGLLLVPYSLTGEQTAQDTAEVAGITIQLLKPSNREQLIGSILTQFPGMITVDYTHPSAVNENAKFYVKHRLPFVMGTTGGDRQALLELAEKAGMHCVIAPNMAKQIVAFQSIIENLAENFPDAFAGYTLSVTESHQKTKADTSGTAKAVVGSFRSMGFNFEDDQIKMVRTETEQLKDMKVPEAFLGGHAFHTYALDSADGTVHFEFQHNICGRKVYAEGTVDAVIYLAKTILKGSTPRVHTMMDILKAGAMK